MKKSHRAFRPTAASAAATSAPEEMPKAGRRRPVDRLELAVPVATAQSEVWAAPKAQAAPALPGAAEPVELAEPAERAEPADRPEVHPALPEPQLAVRAARAHLAE